MNFAPENIDELLALLAQASSRKEKVPPLDLAAFQHIIEYTPEDMTCTVEAGMTLSALQKELGQHRQWLPIDPSRSDQLTIGQLLGNNESGPRRFGYGTIRENLLGIKVVLADGRLIKSGGKVVKNVAGFDLCKLFVGSHGSLGVIVEASFKLQPLPEAEIFMAVDCRSLPEASQMIEGLLDSELTPVVLDLHNIHTLQLVIGFAGGRTNVEWQAARARELGLVPLPDLAYHERFWRDETAGSPHQLSVLPSKLTGVINTLGNVKFLAHAGAGQIWYRGGALPPKALSSTSSLRQRVKDAYDPHHILPDMPT